MSYAIEGNEMERRARRSIEGFLGRRDFTISERNWSCDAGSIDFITTDTENGDLVFIETHIDDSHKSGFAPERINRAVFEKIAAAYLADTEQPEGTVRFDYISMMVVSGSKGFLRHHWNALSMEG